MKPFAIASLTAFAAASAFGVSSRSFGYQDPPRPPVQWEYRVIDARSNETSGLDRQNEGEWDQFGAHGWELVTVHPRIADGRTVSAQAVFKRRRP